MRYHKFIALQHDLTRRRHTAQEYLEAEARADHKSELYQGEIFAMVGATRAHVLIATSIAASLTGQLRGKPCEAYTSDMKVLAGAGDACFYPDVSVACGEPVFQDKPQTVLTNPRVIVEVLSPSTEAFDREGKFSAYAGVPSLTDYLLVAQDRPRIEHLTRDGERWFYAIAAGLDASVELPAIGCPLALADVYDRIVFRESPADRPA